ncbi:MAG: hypothetical protein FJ056_06210 [Cyanobacteria bacterium M_surface_10_m2_179]|nr:hypothetical protein [Cyanobacteria bacterium M_surface_10_m2_179]
MSQLDAFLRWSHPDLLTERLRHGCACWQVLQALQLEPAHCPPPEAGPVSLLGWSGLQLGITSAVHAGSGSASSFALLPQPVSLWLFALLAADAPDPLDPQPWTFWVVPARQLHPDRRSITLQPLLRAHGEGVAHAALAAALLAHLQP